MTADNVKLSQADFLLGHSFSKLHHDIMYTEQAVFLKADCTEQAIASALDTTSQSYSKFYSLRH
jgi:hypothetical protein